jgi:hypothetical protein
MNFVLAVEQWSQRRPLLSKWIGFSLLLAGIYFTMICLGPGAGMLTALILLSTILSLVILLIPLGIINKWTAAMILILVIIFENLI